MTRVWLSVCRGTPWHGCWRVQGAEPKDGQEGVDGNTHQGGEAPACHLYLGSSCCLDLPAPSPHLTDLSTTELEDTFGII